MPVSDGRLRAGLSFVYITFEDGTAIYWARSRVLEYLNSGAQKPPADPRASHPVGQSR